MRVRDLEMKRPRDEETERRRDGETERRRDGETERRRDGESRSVSLSLRLLGSLLLVVLCAANAFAQRAPGAITGRVVADDGQPVRHATINVSSMGGEGRRAGRLTVVSDEDGNFRAEGLDSVPYSISATAPGLVLAPNKLREPRYSFARPRVTVTMIRGGVITGKVTSATGQPLIRIPVRALRVRDESGPRTTPRSAIFGRSA